MSDKDSDDQQNADNLEDEVEKFDIVKETQKVSQIRGKCGLKFTWGFLHWRKLVANLW